jgi:hypothetical protein
LEALVLLERREALLKEYSETSASFRLLTDIRFKLLGFLPLAAGVAAGLSTSRRQDAGTLALSLFGLTVTLGLLTYNERNNQLYNELVGRAAAIERQLGLPDGTFANRPGPWLRIGPLPVEHGTGVGAIYAATVGLWLYGALSSALVFGWDMSTRSAGEVSLPFAVIVPLAGWLMLRRNARARTESMRSHARSAVEEAIGVEPFDVRRAANHPEVLEHCRQLVASAKAKDRVATRATHYARLDDEELLLYIPGSPAPADVRGRERAAAYLVALLTDTPPRWVDDVSSGRRG